MLIQDPDNVPLAQGESLDDPQLTPKALRTVKGQNYLLNAATGLLAAGKLDEVKALLGKVAFLKNDDVQENIERFVLACDSFEKLALADEMLSPAMEFKAKEVLFRESALLGYAPPVDEYMARYKAGIEYHHTAAIFDKGLKAGAEGRFIPVNVLLRMPAADAAAVLDGVARSIPVTSTLTSSMVHDLRQTLRAVPEPSVAPAANALAIASITALTRGVIGANKAREARKLIVQSLRAMPPWSRPTQVLKDHDYRRLTIALRLLRGEDVPTKQFLQALQVSMHSSGEWAAGVKAFLDAPHRREQALQIISQCNMAPQISPSFMRDIDFRDVTNCPDVEREALVSNLVVAENKSMACQEGFEMAMKGWIYNPATLATAFPETTFNVNLALLVEAEKRNPKMKEETHQLYRLLGLPNIQMAETDPALLSSGFLQSWNMFQQFPPIGAKLFTKEFSESRDASGRNILHHMPGSMAMLGTTRDKLVSVVGKERLAQLFAEKDAAGETPLFNPAFGPDTVSSWLSEGDAVRGVKDFDLLAKNAAGLRAAEKNPNLTRATAEQALATHDFLKMSNVERNADWTKLYVSFADGRGRDVTSAMSTSLKLPFDKKKGRMVVEGKDKAAVLDAFSACATDFVIALITAQHLSDLEKSSEPAPAPKKKADIER